MEEKIINVVALLYFLKKKKDWRAFDYTLDLMRKHHPDYVNTTIETLRVFGGE